MRVIYGYDENLAINAYLPQLPEVVVNWSGMVYFAGEDGFVWVCDDGGIQTEKGVFVRNAAYADFETFDGEFGGNAPDEYKKAMRAIRLALSALSTFDPGMDI